MRIFSYARTVTETPAYVALLSLVPGPVFAQTLQQNGFMIGYVIVTLIKWVIYIFLFRLGWRFLRKFFVGKPYDQTADRKKQNNEAMTQFGPTPEARSANIDDTFDKRQATIQFTFKQDKNVLGEYGRSLAAMPVREVEALRTLHHLYNLGMMEENNFYIGRCGLIYADGKGIRYGNTGSNMDQTMRELGRAEQSVNIAMQDLNSALQKNPNHPGLQELKNRFTGGGGDLSPIPPLKSADNGTSISGGLILGLDDKQHGKHWYYDGEGSLITVAPTRSGKTEGQVYPNVLNWRGPMIILDVKGEIYAKTSKWRQDNVGPVYRFSPLDLGRTNCYNPLTAVRSDPMYLWSDAGTLADLMIVPSEGSNNGGGNSKFFEDGARDTIHAAIAYACLEKDPAKRTMSKVLDIIHGIGWQEFVSYLQARVDMPTMARAGGALAAPIPEQTRATILRTAQGSMSAWMGDLTERATSKSDWQPSDFRNGTNPTLYICVNFGDMGPLRSLLRTIIGQHINLLTIGEPPLRTNKAAAPILFLLDEMPQLKNMPPVEKALVVGAGYGVKLWMFVQDIGQLKKEYPNAEGMMGNCAVRMWMNPDLNDGTAQKLSDDIGFRDSIVDGTRVKVVEPNVLAGPEFQDKVIVWARGMSRPARLKKNFAYLDPALTARMGGL